MELDLKDETGVIGYDSQLPDGPPIGAVAAEYDLAEAVATLEDRGHPGHRAPRRLPRSRSTPTPPGPPAGTDEVLQTPDGEMLGTYGGFANYASPAVRQYNLDIALEAVDLGVHDILWDYIRRPEGAPRHDGGTGVGRARAPRSVADFLTDAHAALRAKGAYQGASVFGIAARSGDSIAQDIPAMARAVDYLAPMIYPSHWGEGQYGVDSPIHEPAEIAKRSLADFQRCTAGSGVRLLPWIQDFTLYGVPYGAGRGAGADRRGRVARHHRVPALEPERPLHGGGAHTCRWLTPLGVGRSRQECSCQRRCANMDTLTGESTWGALEGGRVDEGSDPIRVVLVDDHEMFTESLARVLAWGRDIEVLGIGATAAAGIRLAAQHQPDVVVLDYHLPDGEAPDVIAAVLAACSSARVLVLTGASEQRSLLAALDAGALGFVTKDRAVDELVTAVRQVNAGEAFVPAAMLGALLPRLTQRDDRLGAGLSTREREVLACLQSGMANAAIAEQLFLSVHTVRHHVQNLLLKLGAHSKLEAVAIATREGLLDAIR